MVRSCGTANSSTPARLSLLAILAETATVRRDATHDVTGAADPPQKSAWVHRASCVAQPPTKTAMSFEVIRDGFD
jgi:hypothetical protein